MAGRRCARPLGYPYFGVVDPPVVEPVDPVVPVVPLIVPIVPVVAPVVPPMVPVVPVVPVSTPVVVLPVVEPIVPESVVLEPVVVLEPLEPLRERRDERVPVRVDELLVLDGEVDWPDMPVWPIVAPVLEDGSVAVPVWPDPVVLPIEPDPEVVWAKAAAENNSGAAAAIR